MSRFSVSEWEWIARRADRISQESALSLPDARATAVAQLVWLRGLPKADVIEFDPLRRRCAPAGTRRRRR
jgi:hypothetical protein